MAVAVVLLVVIVVFNILSDYRLFVPKQATLTTRTTLITTQEVMKNKKKHQRISSK